MKILGNPGPNRITVTFEEGAFKGRSVTMDAEPVVGGIVLFANIFKSWDGQQNILIDAQNKKQIIELIREELKKNPLSEVVD